MQESHVPPKTSDWPARRVFEWNNYDPSYSARIDIRQEQRYRTNEPVMRVTLRDTTRNASASIQVPKNEVIAMAVAILRAAAVDPIVICEQLSNPADLTEQEKLTAAAMGNNHEANQREGNHREATEARAI